MKTSNYILIAFFTFLFGGILSLFVAAKFHVDTNKLVSKEKPIASFSVVIAEPGSEFTLKAGDTKIVSLSMQDTCYLPRFDIHNDTLILFPYTNVEAKQNVEVYCNRIHEIQGKKNSNIRVHGFLNNSLSIHLTKATLSYYQEPNDKKCQVLKLAANESYVNMTTANFEKLDMQLNNTKIDGWNNSIDSISGTLKNQSELYVRVIKNINIDSDSTCRYNIQK